MPFELGLVIGRYGLRSRRHNWWVFERTQYELKELISDLGGYELRVHGGRPEGVFSALKAAFHKPGIEINVADMKAVYKELNSFADRWMSKDRRGSLYSGETFSDLVYAAARITERRRR
jgi:hypothetical protein